MRFFMAILVVLACFAANSAQAADDQPVAKADSAAANARPDETNAVPVPEPSEKAMQYYRSGNVLWIVSQLVALSIPTLILFTGFSGRMRNAARSIGRKWFFMVAVYFILYSVAAYLLAFPLAYYAGYVRQHAYGLSNQGFEKWLTDSLKERDISTLFGCALLWLPYLLVRRSPRRWWFYTSLLSLPVMVFVMLVEPIWVAPLFNRFGPLKDKQLETKILSLAEQCGIEGSHVFEVDKSVDTNAVNAYVTGLMGTKRIVLWDTLLKKLDTDQTLFVMAHEMGHYVLHHVFLGILVGFVGVLIGLYMVYRLAGLLISRFSKRFGFDQLSDVASLPLVLLLVQVVSLALMPVGMAFSRHLEHEADRFSLELTQNNHAAATAFVKLQDQNLGNPRPGAFYMLWRASHPSIGERIDFANSYRPWAEGKPLVYGHLFERELRESPGKP